MQGKYVTFFDELVGFLETTDTNTIKVAIGDSINNNRTLSVNQVIRFLTTRRTPSKKALGESLVNVYTMLKPTIISKRINARTDAVDINEFLNVYERSVLNSRSKFVKRNIGSQINVAV